MKKHIPSFLLEKPLASGRGDRRGNLSPCFLDRAVLHLAGFIRMSYIQWDMASRNGLFQALDARIKILFLIFFVVSMSLKTSLLAGVLLGVFLLVLVVLSRLSLTHFYWRVLALGGLFGFLIPFPSAFNLFHPGEVILPLFHSSASSSLWIIPLPSVLGITREGLAGVLMLACRVINSLTLTFLVLYTTPFPEIIRGFRVIRFSETVLLIMTLTHKYVFLFVKTVQEIYLARKARSPGTGSRAETRSWIAGRMAFLFRRSHARFEAVYEAMMARGFSGDIKLPSSPRPRPLDIWMGGLLLAAGVLFICL